MFTKLLKHEWRASRSFLAVLCVIILISGLAVGLSVRSLALQDGNEMVIVENEMYVEAGDDMQVLEILCVILTTAGIFAIGCCCVGSIFLLISRFYKRCFTDEGYLSFTLPVSTHQILLSSIVNTVLGTLLVILAAVMGVGVIFVLFLSAAPPTVIWADVWTSWRDVWVQLMDSFRKNADQFILLGISGVFGAFASLIELMLAVTVGAQIARKHKFIAMVAVYYGIQVVTGMMAALLATTQLFGRNLNWLLTSTWPISIVTAVGGYFLMHWLVSKKLNLA